MTYNVTTTFMAGSETAVWQRYPPSPNRAAITNNVITLLVSELLV
jgi:hypothetical protein